MKAEHSLNDLLRISGLPRSSYYYHRQRLREDKYCALAQAIRTLFAQHKGRYGYRRITCTLRQSGFTVNHKTVLKLMRREGLKCQVRRVRYRSYKGQVGRIAPNLLQRKFAATAPNQKWATDVTEFAVGGQKLYLSPIIDLYNGEVVSYALARHPRFEMITRMLEKAFPRIEDNTALLLHSDQGWQYQMGHYRKLLEKKGIRQSMSRKGNCLDNAMAENFFSILKSEMFYSQKFASVEQLESKIHQYINYYNNHRIKLKLKGLSPVKYRTQSFNSA